MVELGSASLCPPSAAKNGYSLVGLVWPGCGEGLANGG